LAGDSTLQSAGRWHTGFGGGRHAEDQLPVGSYPPVGHGSPALAYPWLDEDGGGGG